MVAVFAVLLQYAGKYYLLELAFAQLHELRPQLIRLAANAVAEIAKTVSAPVIIAVNFFMR